MTAAPTRAIPDLCSPRTFPGAAPFAPEPLAATNLARLRAAEIAHLCRSADPRPVRRPRVIRKRATAAVPRGAAERQIPIAPPRRRTLSVPRFPPLEAFGRRPSGPHLRPRQGRHPKPFIIAGVQGHLGERAMTDALLPLRFLSLREQSARRARSFAGRERPHSANSWQRARRRGNIRGFDALPAPVGGSYVKRERV